MPARSEAEALEDFDVLDRGDAHARIGHSKEREGAQRDCSLFVTNEEQH